ncbi:MAG: DUF4386 family protein [Anaerolineae bacterium]|nr:DUF4386 family protein [Anaerolineae bacterium]
MPEAKRNRSHTGSDSDWKYLYRIGASAALLAVLVGIVEIAITFVPGGATTSETVLEWFTLYQENPFLGMRNMGLLNILLTATGVPVYLALFGAHPRSHRAVAALAMAFSFIGVAVFYATNRAFPMLELSNQYAVATTEAQRAALLAAGQAMLSVGQSHTPGTFIGFFLSEAAAVLISWVMLKGKVFEKVTAYVGMAGFAFLMVFEITSSFVPALSGIEMVFAMLGGLASMAWYVLLARRLLRLARA